MVRVVLREMREQKERKAAEQLLYLRYQQCHRRFTLLYRARRERAERGRGRRLWWTCWRGGSC